MIILLKKFPFHIQRKIAEMMDFWDLRQFEISSKYAFEMAEIVNKKVFLTVKGIMVDLDLMIRHATMMIRQPNYAKQLDWNKIKSISNLPRFLISRITLREENHLELLLELARNGQFVFKNNELVWVLPTPLPSERVDEIMTTLRVEKFRCHMDGEEHIRMEYLLLPVFHEMTEIDIPKTNIPTKRLFEFTARRIDVRSLLPKDATGSTVNTLLQQWYSENRELSHLGIRVVPFESMEPEILFQNIPFTILWTKETHESSVLSEYSLDDISKQECAFYLLQKEDQALLVKFLGNDGLRIDLEASEIDRKKDILKTLKIDF